MIEHLRFSQDFLIVEVKAPTIFWDKTLMESEIRKRYNSNVVGIKKHNGKFVPNPNPNEKIEENDILIVVTDSKTANALNGLVKKEFKEN